MPWRRGDDGFGNSSAPVVVRVSLVKISGESHSETIITVQFHDGVLLVNGSADKTALDLELDAILRRPVLLLP